MFSEASVLLNSLLTLIPYRVSTLVDCLYGGELHGQDSEHTHHLVFDVWTHSRNFLLCCSGEN